MSYATAEGAKAALKKEVSPSLGVQLAAELGLKGTAKTVKVKKNLFIPPFYRLEVSLKILEVPSSSTEAI